jgi:hypothetical protein
VSKSARKKNRRLRAKDGAPRTKPRKARIDTPTRTSRKKLPSATDTTFFDQLTAEELSFFRQASIEDLAGLIADAPPEEKFRVVDHVVPRPGDDLNQPQERRIVINARTHETRLYKRRLGSNENWQREHTPRIKEHT